MSMRIKLDNQPEFFTNLDVISGQVILHLNRPEQIGAIVVKLEGESTTSLRDGRDHRDSTLNSESHKILYKVQQVFPDDYHSSANNPFGSYPLNPGQHQFPFKFKVPINNACSDSQAMASLASQSLSGGGMLSGIRLMDGTKQLMLRHVTRTLPPSLSGIYNDAEIRYYLKVTVQRPGLLKENWRFQLGFKFMPIEPPRTAVRGQEAFARRPFSFAPRPTSPQGKRGSFFSFKKDDKDELPANPPPPPQSVELSGRLPHPLVLTCNRPVPLRLIAKKLVNNPQQVYLTSFQMDLIGTTTLSAQGQIVQKSNRWIVASNPHMEVLLITPTAEVGTEIIVPDDAWSQKPLPNTVAPSFTACNISRRYEVQLLLTLRLGSKSGIGRTAPEMITLPLHFANVEVYSGIKPPRELVEATFNGGNGGLRPQLPPRQSVSGPSGSGPSGQAPPLPFRPSGPSNAPPPPRPQPAYAEEYEDAPPSYSEAMAESASMPFDQNNPRPAFSGVTAENAPSQLPPQKS